MIKKTYALFLSVILFLALCPSAAFAAGTAVADATLVMGNDVVATEGSLVDDFNDLLPNADDKYYNLFSGIPGGRNFKIFQEKATDANGGLRYKLVSAAGASGAASTMLEVATNSSYLSMPIQFKLGTSQIGFFRYDIQFKNWQDGDTTDAAVPNLELAYANKCGMKVEGSNPGEAHFVNSGSPGVTKPMELEKWYTVVSEISYDGETSWKMRTHVLDAVTGEILISGAQATNYEHKFSISTVSASKPGDVTFRMDNAALEVYTPASFAPVLKRCSVQEGEKNVPTGGSISVSFDQPIQTAAATLMPTAGGAPVSCSMVKDETRINTYSISWNGYLEEETLYTLDLSGCKNSGEQALSGTNTISFTTGSIPIQETVIRDSFEDTSLFTVDADGHGYYDTQNKTKPFICSGSHVLGGAFLSNSGYTGKAVEVRYRDDTTAASRAAFYSSSAYEVQANDAIVLDYRMKISNAPVIENSDKTFKGGNMMTIGLSAGSSYAPYSSGTAAVIDLDAWTGKHYIGQNANEYHLDNDKGRKGFYYNADTWYNARLVVTQSGICFNLTDINTGELLLENKVAKDLTGQSFYLTPAFLNQRKASAQDNLQGASLTVDDVALWRVKTDRPSHALQTMQSTAAGNGAVTLSFNQPAMAKPSMFALYKGTDKNTRVDVLPAVTYTDFCTNTVTFPGIEPGETYTLDYSGVTGSAGVGFADGDKAAQVITFTVDEPTEPAITAVSCTGTNVGDLVRVNFWAQDAAALPFVAAFYDSADAGRLVGIEVAEQTVDTGKNKITITLTKDVSEAKAASVFVWNSFSELKPVTGMVPLTCGDKKKILLIGNSLSEDAQRNLNNVAELGGANLDVTAAIIGGSTLTNHRANLEAEIGGRTVEQAQQQQAGTEENLRLLYTVYRNSAVQPGQHRLLDVLEAGTYDVVSIQPYSKYDDETFAACLPYLAEQIRARQPKAEFVLYQAWSQYVSETAGQRSLYFNNLIEPSIKKWAAKTPELVSGLTENDGPMTIIPVGRAFRTADENYAYFGAEPSGTNQTETDFQQSAGLWRDVDHASYYGCYLADAVWYEMLTGRKAEAGTEQAPAVPAPAGISAAEHIARLRLLSAIGHTAVLEETANH